MGKTSESIIRLNDQIADLNEALIENGGEVTPEIEEALKTLDLSKAEVAENIQQLVAWNKAEDEYLDAEIKRLQARKKAKKNAVEGLKNWLLQVMMASQTEKLKTTFCTVSVCRGRDSVGGDEEFIKSRYIDAVEEAARDIIPDYLDIDLKLNKTTAMQMLQQGAPIPTHMEGQVELPDIYITRKPYLLIK